MVVFPNAKINIGLNITEKREDGFHNLISCFYPVDWKDILEIIPTKEATSFSSTGIEIPGDPSSNLCLQAYELLKKDYDLPNISIHLHKVIPIGAGLGGGSSDCAFTVKCLNDLFELGLSTEQMENYVRPLGSDCAFFIQNLPILALEKGDVFEEIDLDLSSKHIVLVYPAIHISTKEAYSGIIPQSSNMDIQDALESLPIEEWKDNITNDFETHLFEKYSELKSIKESLYQAGALYASMTGSGSTVYGIFENEPDLPSFPTNYLVKKGKLS